MASIYSQIEERIKNAQEELQQVISDLKASGMTLEELLERVKTYYGCGMQWLK